MENIAERIRNIFVKSFHLEPEEITEEANLRTNLEMDSTETVELVVELEKEFDIKIADNEISNRQTVGEVVTVIRSKL